MTVYFSHLAEKVTVYFSHLAVEVGCSERPKSQVGLTIFTEGEVRSSDGFGNQLFLFARARAFEPTQFFLVG